MEGLRLQILLFRRRTHPRQILRLSMAGLFLGLLPNLRLLRRRRTSIPSTSLMRLPRKSPRRIILYNRIAFRLRLFTAVRLPGLRVSPELSTSIRFAVDRMKICRRELSDFV
jgi:hypothetical protein